MSCKISIHLNSIYFELLPRKLNVITGAKCSVLCAALIKRRETQLRVANERISLGVLWNEIGK